MKFYVNNCYLGFKAGDNPLEGRGLPLVGVLGICSVIDRRPLSKGDPELLTAFALE